MASQPVIPAAGMGAWERLRGAKRSLALLKLSRAIGSRFSFRGSRRGLQAPGARRPRRPRGRGARTRSPGASHSAPTSPDAPGEPVPAGRLPPSVAPPPGARDHPVAAFGSAPYMAWQGGHVRPGPPAGRGRWGEGRTAGEKGRESEAETGGRGADSAAVGGGGGLRSRALAAAPWSGTQAAAEAVAEEGTGAGAGERGGSQRAREGPSLAPGGSRGDSDSDRSEEGAGGGGRGPCPCAPAASGRGPVRWSRSTCARCLEPRARPGRNRWVPRPRPPLPLVLAPCLPLPAQVPFRKRSGMRSPAASQPGQRFLQRPGSSLLAARSAFVRSAGALPRGASGDGPSRTVSALHPNSQLCTPFPSVARRPQEWRRRGCAVSGWRPEETGLTS